MNNLFSLSKLSNFCIYLVLVLVNISYCPGVILTPNYKNIMAIIMIAIAISLILNISKDFVFALSLYLYYGLYSLIICSVIFLFNDVFIFNTTSNIFLTITCFLLGYCSSNHDDVFINRCMKIFAVSALFLGIYSVYINLGNFIISERYVFAVKNSSGVLLGSAIILCMFILNNSQNKKQIAIWSTIMLLLLLCLLVFRCRTAIITVFISAFLFLYKKNLISGILQKPLILLGCIILVSLIGWLDFGITDFIYNSLFANKDVSSLDSITSGRLSTYESGLQAFYENPFLGNSILRRHLPPIDNFIISNLAYNGIVGALLMFPPYIITWYICLKGLFTKSVSNLYPFLTLFLICMTSFTEGPYPFGPGTPVVCAWFLLGWWYKSNQLESTEENWIGTN